MRTTTTHDPSPPAAPAGEALIPHLPARRAPVRRRARALARLAADAGQGTVEYVGLLLLMASVLAAIVVASKGLGGNDAIGKKVVDNIGVSIDKAAAAKPEGK